MNEILLYFIVGVVFDIIITIYYLQINKKSILGAGIMSAVVTVASVFIMYNILLSPEMLEKTIAYSLGAGIGTSATIYWNNKNEQTSPRPPHGGQPTRKI